MRFKSLDAAAYELAAVAAGPWAGAALAWFYALAVGFTNALPMQVGVARVLYAMGRDRQLPKFLALMHPAHNTPWAAMVVSTLVSLAVALWMRNDMDRLASIVNFGALTGFVLLHVSVVVHFAVRGGSRRWLIHLISPALGISVVGAVLTGMNPLALKLGLAWLAIGAIYGLYLNARGRAAAALGSRDSAVM